jgi:hypothetical protein
VSWAVGDPKRKQENWMEAEDSRSPGEVEIKASHSVEGLKRQSDELYKTEVRPDSPGFHRFKNETYAYNYNSEIEEIGYSDTMKKTVRDTGGKVYTPEEREELKQDLKNFAENKTNTKKSLSTYLILLAMIIFLGEVGYRKLNGKK